MPPRSSGISAAMLLGVAASRRYFGGWLSGGRTPQQRGVRRKRSLVSRWAHINAPVGAMASAGTTLGTTAIAEQNRWSYPSDPVEIIVGEPSYPKPSISLSPSGGVAPGGYVTIRCECRCQGVMVFVYKAGHPAVWRATDSAGDVVEFPISNVSQGDAGSYSCRYNIKSDPPLCSEPSDPVELVVAGETDPTLAGTTPTPTRPGSAGPSTAGEGRKLPSTPQETEGTNSTKPEMTTTLTHSGSAGTGGPELKRSIPIIAGVSAAAAGLLLLLLLLLAFVCCRRTRGRKGPAPRQSRESEAASTVYALIGEGKQLDVLPQEPDPGAEGLTYAELDGQVLQAKRGGPDAAPEPVLYATISESPRGGSHQSDGAGSFGHHRVTE